MVLTCLGWAQALSLNPYVLRPQNDEKQFAKQQAPLLILHAPRLSKVMAIKGSNAFNRALRRTYTMLAAPRKVLWELPQGEYNASSGALSD